MPESAKTGKPIPLRLPWTLEALLEEERKRQGRSKQDQIRWLIGYALDHLERKRKEQPFDYSKFIADDDE